MEKRRYKMIAYPEMAATKRGQKVGAGKGRGIPGGMRRNKNVGPGTSSGPGYGQGGGRGKGRNR